MGSHLLSYPLNGIFPFIGSISIPALKTFGISHFGCIDISDGALGSKFLNLDTWEQIYVQEEFFYDINSYDTTEIFDANIREEILHDPNMLVFLLLHEGSEGGENTVFFFGADEEGRNVLNYYIRYPRVLNYFIFHFKEKMYNFLKIEKNKIIRMKFIPLNEIEKNSLDLIDLRRV